MNAIFFGAKRAFHGSLSIARGALKFLGLTPARFDMLTAIWRHPCGVFQRELRQMLGVTHSTISRMLRSIEQLGLVHRCRPSEDRRKFHVTLTVTGLALIRRATRLLVGSGVVQLAVDCALVGPERCHDGSLCFAEMEVTESALCRLRAAFGDEARLHYPWHPDD